MEWISWLVTQGVVPMIAYTEGTTEQMYEAADRAPGSWIISIMAFL